MDAQLDDSSLRFVPIPRPFSFSFFFFFILSKIFLCSARSILPPGNCHQIAVIGGVTAAEGSVTCALRVHFRGLSRERRTYTCVYIPTRFLALPTGRLSWLLRKQTKERNEGTGALGGPAPLFMGHCICWPRITLHRRPVWSHLTSDFTFDSLLANGSCISIRWPAVSRYYKRHNVHGHRSYAIFQPRYRTLVRLRYQSIC